MRNAAELSRRLTLPPLAFLPWGLVDTKCEEDPSRQEDTREKVIFGLCQCVRTLSPELWRPM